MLPEIDPVEAALAVIGVRPLISKAVERVTAAQFFAMTSYARRLQRLATELCRAEDGRMADVPLGEINYGAVARELAEQPDQRQLEQMVARFPADHHDLAAAFQTKALNVLAYLQLQFPFAVSTTLAGRRNWRPSEILVRRFVCVLEVLDDPTRVFALMAAGALLRRQVAAMRAVYPTLSAFVDAAIDDPADGAIVREKAAKKSYEVPPRAERGILVWLGRPLAGKLHKDLQAAYRQADAERAAAPRPSNSRTSPLAKEALTSAQRSMYPDALRSDSR